MKIEELRIGDWVECETEFFQIETLQSKNHWKFNGNKGDIEINLIDKNKDTYWCELKDINPIPITEEWLLKFGFKKKEKFITWSGIPQELLTFIHEKYSFTFEKLNFLQIHSNYYGTLYFDIQYIHQLQNLFYSITQTELEIK